MYSCYVSMAWDDVKQLALSPQAFANATDALRVRVHLWGFTYTLRQVTPAHVVSNQRIGPHGFNDLDDLAIHFRVEAQEGTGDDRRDDDPRLGGRLDNLFDADNPMLRLGALVTLQSSILCWVNFLPAKDSERQLGSDRLWHMPAVADFLAACDRHLQGPHERFDYHTVADWMLLADEADIADIGLARGWEQRERTRDFFNGGQGSL